jgi:Mn-containing catalase
MARDQSHRPPRGVAYHKSAIAYNEGMAARARELSAEVDDKEVKRWCRSVARQHDEHTAYHRKALSRLEKQKERKKLQRQRKKAKPRPKAQNEEALSQAEFAAEQEAASRRPIPRDPRVGRKPVPSPAEAGVGTPIDEKQEASA